MIPTMDEIASLGYYLVAGVIAFGIVLSAGIAFAFNLMWVNKNIVVPLSAILKAVTPNGGTSPMDKLMLAAATVFELAPKVQVLIDDNNKDKDRMHILERKVFAIGSNLAVTAKHVELLHNANNYAAWRTDRSGLCVSVNTRWEELAGISSAQAQGNGWIQGIAEEDRERVFSIWMNCVEKRVPISAQFHMVDRKGTRTRVSCKGDPILDPDSSEPIGWAGMNIPIAEPIEPPTQL